MGTTGTRDGTTVATVVADLRAAIVSGDLPAGSALRTEALATRLGTSRVPVREALHELAGEGLVELRDRCGARVVDVERTSNAELLELISVRRALEPLAASEAAANRSEPELAQLQRLLHLGQQAALDGDGDAAAQAHHDLLLAVVAASANHVLAATCRPLIDKSAVIFRLLAPEALPDGWAAHAACCAAIAAGDRRTAAAVTRHHLDDIRAVLLRHGPAWRPEAPPTRSGQARR